MPPSPQTLTTAPTCEAPHRRIADAQQARCRRRGRSSRRVPTVRPGRLRGALSAMRWPSRARQRSVLRDAAAALPCKRGLHVFVPGGLGPAGVPGTVDGWFRGGLVRLPCTWRVLFSAQTGRRSVRLMAAGPGCIGVAHEQDHDLVHWPGSANLADPVTARARQ